MSNKASNGEMNQVPVEEKRKKAQRARNLAIALCLSAFVILLYVVTWSKLGANVMVRPL